MYHAIVKRISRRNFELVNNHQDEALLRSCVPNMHHRFGGSHALGGERHDVDGLRRWLVRLHHLNPTLHLEVTDVWVKGLPNDTTVIVRWNATQQEATLDGSLYVNHGVHVIKLRWLRLVSTDANENSQAVEEFLRAAAARGVTEADAAPITS